jgi:hypothetical protein
MRIIQKWFQQQKQIERTSKQYVYKPEGKESTTNRKYHNFDGNENNSYYI